MKRPKPHAAAAMLDAAPAAPSIAVAAVPVVAAAHPEPERVPDEVPAVRMQAGLTAVALRKRTRTQLYAELGIPERMPADFSMPARSVWLGDWFNPEQQPSLMFAQPPREPGPCSVRGNVYVLAKTQARRAHRVMVICPVCNGVEPLSRLHQHLGSGECLDRMRRAQAREGLLASRARSVCLCGHTGDVGLPGGPSQHRGLIGHGACRVEGCVCAKFTWHHYIPEPKGGER